MVSCSDKNDGGETKTVELLSFGPSPIPRGAALRIIGRNLDKVQSVVLPGCDAISDIIKVGNDNTEINVTVPKDAESGKIVLNAGSQQITSITDLTIAGNINLTSFSPTTARAGDVITLTGEDLDFVKEVIFSNDIHVVKDSFVSSTLTSIEVKVPMEAQTGKIAVSNGADDPILAYFEDNLNVVLPTIESFSPTTIRSGTELTITGKDFDLVESVSFEGNKTAETFTVNDTKTSITVTVPVDAQDGPVVLTAFSGVTVSSATDLIMLVPTITAMTPNPVYAGDKVTITGTDLDLINKVTFGGSVVGDVQPGGTATQITVQVPGSAKTGNVEFATINNKTVTSTDVLTVEIKIVYGPETTIWEGNVSIGWGSPTVDIPASAFAGVPAGSMIVFYFTQTPNWGQAQINNGKWAAIAGLGDLGDGYFKTGDVGDASVTSYENELTQTVLDNIINNAMPDNDANHPGAGIIIQGQEWNFNKVTIKEPVVTETIVWEGNTDLGEWGGSVQMTNAASLTIFADVKAGQTLEITLGAIDMSAGWAQFIVKDSGWANIDGFTIGVSGTDTVKDIAITQALLDIMQSGGILLQGYHVHITKVAIK